MSGRAWRCLLFVPGDRTDRMPKAVAAGPDAVILDLEDSVHPSKLREARTQIAQALAGDDDVTRVVRVHSVAAHAELLADLDAVVGRDLDAVLLPKTTGPDDVVELERLIRLHEQARGIEVGHTSIIPVIEDCGGLRRTFDIARSSERITAMSIAGAEEGDLMASIGGIWTPDGMALHYAKSHFISEVRAASRVPIIDGPVMHLDSEEILRSESRISRVLGFDGKVAIHPRQVATIREFFVPTADAVRRARAVVEEAESASADGRGVSRLDGVMIDSANVRTALRVLEGADSSSDL